MTLFVCYASLFVNDSSKQFCVVVCIDKIKTFSRLLSLVLFVILFVCQEMNMQEDWVWRTTLYLMFRDQSFFSRIMDPGDLRLYKVDLLHSTVSETVSNGVYGVGKLFGPVVFTYLMIGSCVCMAWWTLNATFSNYWEIDQRLCKR